jgi:hypothetical protein
MVRIAAPAARRLRQISHRRSTGPACILARHEQGARMTRNGRVPALAAAVLLGLLACAAPQVAAQDVPDTGGAMDGDSVGADGGLGPGPGDDTTMFSGGDDDWSSGDASDRGTASLGDSADRDRAFGSFRGAGGSFDEGGHPRF